MQPRLGGADVGTAPCQFRREAEEARRRPQRALLRGPSSPSSAPGGSSSRKAIAFEYCDLPSAASECARDAFDLRGRALRVEAGGDALPLPLLRDFLDIASDRQILVGDGDLRLRAAQLNVIAREFGQRRDQRVAAHLGRLIDLRVGGFDRAPHMAPKVELPRRVEADGPIADRRNRPGRRRWSWPEPAWSAGRRCRSGCKAHADTWRRR